MTDRPQNRPDKPKDDTQWRTAGDRIQTLLDSCASGGTAAYQRAQQLVREVIGLYGAGLERIVALSDDGVREQLATDDLVASLLLVHGLHPHDLHRRVSDALDRVRPYLGSHGGDVDLIEVTDDARVLLAFQGSCKSCPSSAATLELAVRDAIAAAAPEICAIEVVTTERATVIPAESLLAHVRSNVSWQAFPEPAELAPGEVGGFAVAGLAVLACRVGEKVLAYRDHCPVCIDSLAGARLTGQMLRCPCCGTEFDVVRAGAGPPGVHLEPLPLLTRDGVLSVALPGEVLGAPA